MKNSLLKLLFGMVLDPQVGPIAWTTARTRWSTHLPEPSYGFSIGLHLRRYGLDIRSVSIESLLGLFPGWVKFDPLPASHNKSAFPS